MQAQDLAGSYPSTNHRLLCVLVAVQLLSGWIQQKNIWRYWCLEVAGEYRRIETKKPRFMTERSASRSRRRGGGRRRRRSRRRRRRKERRKLVIISSSRWVVISEVKCLGESGPLGKKWRSASQRCLTCDMETFCLETENVHCSETCVNTYFVYLFKGRRFTIKR